MLSKICIVLTLSLFIVWLVYALIYLPLFENKNEDVDFTNKIKELENISEEELIEKIADQKLRLEKVNYVLREIQYQKHLENLKNIIKK